MSRPDPAATPAARTAARTAAPTAAAGAAAGAGDVAGVALRLASLPHPRLLLVRLDNIGDVVLLSPAVRALKQALPGSFITLWTTKAGAQAAPLLEGVDDLLVSRPIWQEVGRTTFRPEDDRRLILTLRAARFDAAFIFTSYSQTPHPAAAVCALAAIPLRVGSSYERAAEGLLAEASPPAFEAHQAEHNLRLLEAAGFAVRDRAPRLCIPEWRPDPAPPRDYLVVSPWASCHARSYPAGRMMDAARMIAASRGWTVFLAGRSTEREFAAALPSSPAGPQPGSTPVDLVGRTTVPQFAALIAGARLVFCNNTLAMHLADAAGVPSVVTYAGTDLASQWAPRKAPHRLLTRPVPCSPCFLLTCPYGQRCLDIPADEVAVAAEGLLAGMDSATYPRGLPRQPGSGSR